MEEWYGGVHESGVPGGENAFTPLLGGQHIARSLLHKQCRGDRHRVAKPLHRHFNASWNDHFYMINGEEIGTGTPDHGYKYEGIIGYVLTD